MIALVIAVMVGFIIGETLVAIAKQNDNISRYNTTALNSTDSEGKNIVVTWLNE